MVSEHLIKRLMEVIEEEQAKAGTTKQGDKRAKATIEVSGPVLCPEMCFRFQETSGCVHLEKTPAIAKSYTTAFHLMQEEKREKRLTLHKSLEKLSEWKWLLKEDWKSLPFTYGVYIWVDEWDKPIYVAKASDFRRRHFTWEAKKDPRWANAFKIWYLHTGWYMEVLTEISRVEPMVITKELLDVLLKNAKPLVLPDAPSLPTITPMNIRP